ncbi:response regulator [Thiolapillus sp.]|uniref:response regulator n=1 Tax=Thiolapillus sp. TaxID=2017437 RepID=UPI0025E74695
MSSYEFYIELKKGSAQQPDIPTNSLLAGRKLWMVEPNPTYQAALRNMLPDLDVTSHEITTYQNAISALKQGESAEFIILAVTAKAFTSETVAQELEDIIQYASIPVLVLLGSSDQDVMNHITDLGAARCLSKPIRPGILAQAINDILLSDSETGTGKYAEPAPSHPADWLSGTRILVADDNDINRKLMRNVLGNYAATVICTEDGAQAVEAVRDMPIDIALIDIHMPNLNGLEAVAQIRQIPEAKTLPLIAMTADAMGRNRAEIENSGFDTFLIKPIEEEDLLSVIAKFLFKEDGGPEGFKSSAQKAFLSRRQLPVYDRPQAMRITGNSPRIATTMLNQLVESLEDSMEEIARLVEEKDWKALWQNIHKLQGAAAICAVPALSASLNRLQVAVQNKNAEITAQELKETNSEMQRLIQYHAELD